MPDVMEDTMLDEAEGAMSAYDMLLANVDVERARREERRVRVLTGGAILMVCVVCL